MCNAFEVLLVKYMAGINSGEAEKLGEMEAAEAGGLHGQRHDQSVRVLQQRKGVQQGQVKGCEVRPLPPLAKPSFWYAFAHAWPTGFILNLAVATGWIPCLWGCIST